MTQRGALRRYNDAWKKRWDDVNSRIAKITLTSSRGKKDGGGDGEESKEDDEHPSRPEAGSRKDQLCPSCKPEPDVR